MADQIDPLGSNVPPHVLQIVDVVQDAALEHCRIVLEDFLYEKDLSAVEADLTLVLGGDGAILRAARQMGSLVAPDRLRFDYAIATPPTPEQIAEI